MESGTFYIYLMIAYSNEAVGGKAGEVVIHLRQVSLTNTSDRVCSAFVSQSANSKILSLQFHYWWQWNVIRQYLQDKSKD